MPGPKRGRAEEEDEEAELSLRDLDDEEVDEELLRMGSRPRTGPSHRDLDALVDPFPVTAPGQLPRMPVRDNAGAPHTLFVTVHQGAPVLMIASEPMPYEAYLTALQGRADLDDTQQKAVAVARELSEDFAAKTEPGKGEWSNWSPDAGLEVQRALAKLALCMRELPGPDVVTPVGSAARPPSEMISWNVHVTPDIPTGDGGTVGSRDGAHMIARVSLNPGGLIGTEPTQAGQSEMLTAANRLVGRSSPSVAGHLLNHHLGGTGADLRNLVPLSRSDNTTMERTFEAAAKAAVLRENEVLHYDVTPIWPAAPQPKKDGPEAGFPTALEVNVERYAYTPPGHGAEADNRQDWANWKVAGPPLYHSRFKLHPPEEGKRVVAELREEAQGLLGALDETLGTAQAGAAQASAKRAVDLGLSRRRAASLPTGAEIHARLVVMRGDALAISTRVEPFLSWKQDSEALGDIDKEHGKLAQLLRSRSDW